MEKKYKRKAFYLILLSPLLATLLAKILFVIMAITCVWDTTTGFYIYLVSFDVSLKIWGLFILWEQMKIEKAVLKEEGGDDAERNE